MRHNLKHAISVASFAVAGAMITGGAHAQTATFSNAAPSESTYALLNGQNLALYVDQTGDLGAPYQASAPNKPGGVQSPPNSGHPLVTPSGAVDQSSGANSYAALFTPNDTSGAGSLQASLQQKIEYITLGNVNATEGWSLSLVGATGLPGPFRAYNSPFVTSTAITTNGNPSVFGLLSATSTDTVTSGGQTIGVSQNVSFNTVGNLNVAKCIETFSNPGTAAATIQYARGVNPQQDVAGSGGSNTNEKFGTLVNTGMFAVDSTGPNSGRQLALGASFLDTNSGGTIIYSTDGSQTESALLGNPSLAGQHNHDYIQLDPSGPGATYHDTGTGQTSHTTDYTMWVSSGGLTDPFTGPAGNNPAFFTGGTDTDLVLLSPDITVPAGGTNSYTFYYTFGNVNGTGGVPEPGVLPLVASALCGCGWAARARRRK